MRFTGGTSGRNRSGSEPLGTSSTLSIPRFVCTYCANRLRHADGQINAGAEPFQFRDRLLNHRFRHALHPSVFRHRVEFPRNERIADHLR